MPTKSRLCLCLHSGLCAGRRPRPTARTRRIPPKASVLNHARTLQHHSTGMLLRQVHVESGASAVEISAVEISAVEISAVEFTQCVPRASARRSRLRGSTPIACSSVRHRHAIVLRLSGGCHRPCTITRVKKNSQRNAWRVPHNMQRSARRHDTAGLRRNAQWRSWLPRQISADADLSASERVPPASAARGSTGSHLDAVRGLGGSMSRGSSTSPSSCTCRRR